MADVQLRDGHIRIANRLFRAAILAKLSPVESRCLMECLWRQYGWAIPTNAPEPFKVGGSALAQAVGGSRSTASQALTTLVDAGILAPTGETDDRGRRSFLVQKDYERWTCGFHRNPSRVHWTPRAGDVSPLQNASVLIPERERPNTGTPTTTQTRAVVESPGALEPRENQVENQAPLLLTPDTVDPVITVWAGYVEGRTNQRKAPGKDARKDIAARLKAKATAEDLILVSRWVLNAPDWYCGKQRESGNTTYSTIYKAKGMEDRIDKARAWESGGAPKAPAGRPEGGSADYVKWMHVFSGRCWDDVGRLFQSGRWKRATLRESLEAGGFDRMIREDEPPCPDPQRAIKWLCIKAGVERAV